MLCGKTMGKEEKEELKGEDKRREKIIDARKV